MYLVECMHNIQISDLLYVAFVVRFVIFPRCSAQDAACASCLFILIKKHHFLKNLAFCVDLSTDPAYL